jgi:hypothetical protein
MRRLVIVSSYGEYWGEVMGADEKIVIRRQYKGVTGKDIPIADK